MSNPETAGIPFANVPIHALQQHARAIHTHQRQADLIRTSVRNTEAKVMRAWTANEPNQPLCDLGGQLTDRASRLQRLLEDH